MNPKLNPVQKLRVTSIALKLKGHDLVSERMVQQLRSQAYKYQDEASILINSIGTENKIDPNKFEFNWNILEFIPRESKLVSDKSKKVIPLKDLAPRHANKSVNRKKRSS